MSNITDSMKLVLLIRSYQVRGHVMSKLDPLNMDSREEPPELKPSKYEKYCLYFVSCFDIGTPS